MHNFPQTTRFTLPLEEAQNVALADRSLDVTNDGTSSGTTTLVVHEFDTDLCDVTGVSGSAQHAVDLGKLDGLIL